MSNHRGRNFWPNSATRKMYGEAGRRLAYARKQYSADRETMEKIHNATISELRKAVSAYESLGWWKRFWLLILDVFGKRKSILL